MKAETKKKSLETIIEQENVDRAQWLITTNAILVLSMSTNMWQRGTLVKHA